MAVPRVVPRVMSNVTGEAASDGRLLEVVLPPVTSSTLVPKTGSATQPEQKRQKRYAPKVRTGCLTCKKRRVKCDETKPKCLKCLNSDYQCDGYAVPKAWIFEPSASKRQNVKEERRNSGNNAEDADVLELRPSPSTQTFTPDEARSMQFYLRRSGRMVAKYDHSRYAFWMEMLPRAAHRLEPVKHVLVATALQDELLTCPTTIPRIERRIMYHYQQALSKTVHTRPTIDHILLNCLGMFYFDSLRDNTELIVLHIQSARKIIDEWRSKDEKAPPEVLDIIEAVDGIVTEALSYCQIAPDPSSIADLEWDKAPTADPYDSVDDAEHALIACLGNLCRSAGQVPLALVRANAFLRSWVADGRSAIKKADVDTTLNLASLFQIAKDTINLLDEASQSPQEERWFQLYNSLQDLPKLRSVKYRKPVIALMSLLQQKSQTKEQATATKALYKHLQRGILYDE
ncbi:uncharacterized protein PV09_05710 [Verruconis gallopava]|uniref:Zn(2)-C6 fungal-type domain-containing protein n=1 Tax=Verruconis gallopava TaxID=253628 RepID=A0A0D1XL32_9PEZI|nr:uncharacterized protein PV09_05710 [Verruconis gallopava]KIW03061.1 hypothetical protein PV09_05710 [Verruconis gallopava]